MLSTMLVGMPGAIGIERAAACGADEHLVEDPVVGAGEHGDSVPARDRAGDADRRR